MKLSFLLLAVIFPFFAHGHVKTYGNAQAVAKQMVRELDWARGQFYHPNDPKRLLTDAEFGRVRAASTCAILGVVDIRFLFLQLRAATEMDRDDASQVALYEAMEGQRTRLGALQGEFCDMRPGTNAEAGRPRAFFVRGLDGLRADLKWSANRTFPNNTTYRSVPASDMISGIRLIERLNSYVYDQNGNRNTGLLSVGSYMRACNLVGQAAVWFASAVWTRDLLKEDIGRPTNSCDRQVKGAHAAVENLLKEFCYNEKTGLALTAGEVTDNLIDTLEPLLTTMKEARAQCR